MTLQGNARPSARQDLSPDDLRTLFTRYSAGDARAREAIIVGFLPYAYRLAHRYRGRGEPVEDLRQAASVGLIKAVDRCEPERCDSFTGFAKLTILGEIRRHFRDLTWRVHVPRPVRERTLQVAQAQEHLRAQSGSEPTEALIATHLGLEPDQIAEAQTALKAYRPASLDAAFAAEDSQGVGLSQIGECDLGYGRAEDRLRWTAALASLQARERSVLLMRFGGEFTQSEIAERVGVSQMQVSRILRDSSVTVAAALDRV
jgi:RNA polymerase sigma-B factor